MSFFIYLSNILALFRTDNNHVNLKTASNLGKEKNEFSS